MFVENVKLALTALMANKLRTFLTMLGIIIGIAAVIAIMTIGESTVEQTKQEYADMGVNIISFYVYLSDSIDMDSIDTSAEEYQPQFTKEQVTALVNKYKDSIGQVVVESWGADGKIYSDSGSVTDGYSSVISHGVNRGYFDMPDKNFVFVAGKPFDQRTEKSDSTAVIISDKSAQILYGDSESAIGKKLHYQFSTYNDDGAAVYNKELVVTGVYEYHPRQGERPNNSVKPNDVSYTMYVPYLAMLNLIDYQGGFANTYFSLNMKPGTDVMKAAEDMKADMISLMPSDGRFEVEAEANAKYIKQAEDAVRQRNLVTTLTGAIALLVGGIGVMNIMTVSIIERTREIGTRKALGALNSDIRLQFITEAMVICLIGGIIGIFAGIAIGIGACKIQGIPVAISYESVLLSFVVSLLIGLFFGYYPANKAAKMDPIEALRYE